MTIMIRLPYRQIHIMRSTMICGSIVVAAAAAAAVNSVVADAVVAV